MALYSHLTLGQLEPNLGLEWLLTNGMGAFSSSTVVGCNTRRYHGLLCAATLPPVGRMMALNRIGEIVLFDGKEEPLHELGVNQFGHNFHPRGDRYLRQFEIDDVARWKFQIEEITITKELQLLWQQNTIAIRYTIEMPRPRPVELKLVPFIGLRDFHSLRHADGSAMHTTLAGKGVMVSEGGNAVHLLADGAKFIENPDWWFGHTYDVETERGLDDTEDLFAPGAFVFQTFQNASVTLVASTNPVTPVSWEAEISRRTLATGGKPSATVTQKRLQRAANDFIVRRSAPDGTIGATILAGYPWFADWGRDTMISLPGLLLCTGRLKEAGRVLSIFANYVSEGMIPNRFDDYDNHPHYNTVDASLWFIHACFEYAKATEDKSIFETTLFPACRQIIDGYRNGTRFHIKMDESDGLISQGDANTQLTWMDAKCNGIAFTPRQGKAVEINALWYHALKLMKEDELAARVEKSFRQAFWISPFRGLNDVVDGKRKDAAIRPNQIFAVSLPNSPLSEIQQRGVVEVVRRELLTPYGLRSLGPSEQHYHGSYHGGPMQRDEAYHNGTVWGWLIGPFLSAYLRVNNRSAESLEQSRQWLQPMIDHLEQACIGQISEIFEGDLPHRPVGCFAQAWSVAEVLRLAMELDM